MNDPDLIRIACPSCAKKIAVKSELAGRRVRCPNPSCGKFIEVPDDEDDVQSEAGRRVLWPWLAGGAAVLVVLGGLGIWALTRGNRPAPPVGEPPVAAPPVKSAPVTEPAEAKEPLELPGSAGERVTFTNRPPDVRDIFLFNGDEPFKPTPEEMSDGLDKAFPSGTTRLKLCVIFSREQPEVRIAARLRSTGGKLEIAETKPHWLVHETNHACFLDLKPATGVWQDGPYQAEVVINDVKVAVLNWSITKDAPKSKPAETIFKQPDPPKSVAVPTKPVAVTVDKDLTYEKVKYLEAKYVGKRVEWPAWAIRLDGNVLLCAARVEDKAGNRLLPHWYHVVIKADESARFSLFAELFRAENTTVTGTISGSETILYDIEIPGDPKQTYKTTIPVLVDATIRAGGRIIHAHFGPPTDLTAKMPGAKPPGVIAQTSFTSRAVESGFALSPDGLTIAAAGGFYRQGRPPGHINLFDARSGAWRATFPLPFQAKAVTFTPDGQGLLVTRSEPYQKEGSPPVPCLVQLLDAATGKVIRSFEGHKSANFAGINFVGVTEDGKTLVTATQDDPIRVWDLATGKERKTHPLPAKSPWVAGLSRDGTRLVMHASNKVLILDTMEGKEVGRIDVNAYGDVDFSPDGTRLAVSVSGDHTIRILDIVNNKEQSTLKAPEGWWPSGPRFSKDGTKVYFTANNKSLRCALGVGPADKGGAATILQEWDEYLGGLIASADRDTLAASTVRSAGETSKYGARIWHFVARPPAPPAPPSPPEDEVVLLGLGPAGKGTAPVMRFVGDDLAKALKAGNRLADTNQTAAAVRIHPKFPREGTIEWRGYERWRDGVKEVVEFREAITLEVRRKSPTTTDWELNTEAAQTVQQQLAKRK